MGSHNLTIGFVRRGFSSTGGAESYLNRLAAGIVEKGHQVRLYTSGAWPSGQWQFGPIIRVKARSAIGFADEMRKLRSPLGSSNRELLLSLERIWGCNVYRAGDGVHRAWLEQRARVGGPLQRLSRLFNPKHSNALALEKSLFSEGGADRVIANSEMVEREIVNFYGFPKEKIHLIYNGVPTHQFEGSRDRRAQVRERLGLKPNDIAVLFVGSGWMRKGLRFALQAVKANANKMRLFVAGRGDKQKFRSGSASFLDVVAEMPPLYGAADIFLLPTLYDPFSNACLEAFASGLPVVTTRANGFSEIIKDGVHGSVIDDPRDLDAMSSALRFWADPERREHAQTLNVALAKKFDISVNVARTLAMLTNHE